MKFTFVFILTIGFSSFSVAQQEDSNNKKFYHHEIGVDLISLTNEIISLKSDQYYFPFNPSYQITYRYRFQNWSINYGMGLISEADKRSFYRHLASIRLGIERDLSIGKRFQISAGLYARASHFAESTRKINDEGIETHQVFTGSFGISPSLGMRYLISRRISISSEANFDILKSKSFYEDQPSGCDECCIPIQFTTTNIETNFIPPLSLFLNVAF